ncbi:hypothetical protein GCM10009560_51660 [Nonomuraea longicatena]|uniref:WD40 repeat domain-containing protein n=1 Tax=Nonomuraea longicatena TaxID=83682 RepID=A0ABP4ARU5_9ACTN
MPQDLAERALRRRARRPLLFLVPAAAVSALVVTVGMLVGLPDRTSTVRPASVVTLPARPSPAPTDVRADVDNMPPKKLIAAGNYAVSAYWQSKKEKGADGIATRRQVWSLYNPRTEEYETTPYAWVDVAPGLRTAAFVEGDLLGRTVGILDMGTGEVIARIPLEHDVLSVDWSPDGTRLLATAYSAYPYRTKPMGENSYQQQPSSVTGYYVIDVPNAKAVFHPPLPEKPDEVSSPQPPLTWSLDGSLIRQHVPSPEPERFFTPEGEARPKPADRISEAGVSAVSPDGKLLLGGAGLPTKITELEGGKVVGNQKVLQLHAWADDETVLALKCARECDDEFDSALSLIKVDGTEVQQLSGFQRTVEDGAWDWVLTPR